MSFACPVVPIIPYAAYCGEYTDSTSPASYSFASCNLSYASSSRLIVVCVGSRDSASTGATHGAVTVAGISATKVVEQVNSVMSTAIYMARVPTGTTGTITVAIDDTVDHMWIQVYALYGLKRASAYGAAAATGTDSTSLSSLAVEADAIVIASCCAVSGITISISGVTSPAVTTALETGSYRTGRVANAVRSSAYAISATHTGSAFSSLIAASFR